LAFAIESPPERLPTGMWRVRWEAEAGRLYVLQRWNSPDLGVAGEPAWLDVAMVRATGGAAFADDPVSGLGTVTRGFYRVKRVVEGGGGGDGLPPVVSAMDVRFTAIGLESAAALEVVATDDVGVTRVEFLNGGVVLGVGVRGGNGAGDRWRFVLPLDRGQLGARFLVARAYDAAGNFGDSPVFRLGLVDPDHFVPLGAGGEPEEGGIVEAVGPGAWGPVEYRPGGRSLFGFGAGFYLRFPNGVMLRQVDGRPVLEFTNVVAGFGAGHPLQMREELRKEGGAARQLAVGPVSVARILEIFGRPAGSGLAVRLYDRFDLEWTGGEIDDGGIVGARFRVAGAGLPLPGDFGGYPGFRLDFTRSRGVALPFHGSFELPDGSANPARLHVGAAGPLWLTLSPDGRMGMVGSAAVELGNGGSFRADVRLDDPYYQLSMSAEGLRLEGLAGLGGFLSDQVAGCVPAGLDPGALAEAGRCLEAHRQGLREYLGSAVAAGVGLGVGVDAVGTPPGPFDAVAGVLEAWGRTALVASGPGGMRLELIRELVVNAGRAAAGAHDLETALAHRRGLVRVRAAVQAGRMTAGAEARAELERALEEAESAVVSRAGEADAVASLDGMLRVVRAVVETEAIRQGSGLGAGRLVTQALPGLVDRFARRFATSLGVTQAGVFTPAGNAVVQGLERLEAAEHVGNLVELLTAVEGLGLGSRTGLLKEVLGQVSMRLAELTGARLAAAEAAGDYAAFLLALEDFAGLVAARESAVFPGAPVLGGLPRVGELAAAVGRLGGLMALELDRPLGERSLNNHVGELRALVSVMRAVPGAVSIGAGSLRRVFDQIEARLAEGTTEEVLAGQVGLGELVRLVEAGGMQAEYGRRFGFLLVEDWESVRLPRVVARIAHVALGGGGWSELVEVAGQLMEAAERQGVAGLQGERRANLVQAGVLLQAAREMARRAGGELGGVEGLADLRLPGDISVDRVAGSVRYHRLQRSFGGSLRGRLQLPKFGTRLEVLNASLGSGGALDLSASGELALPAGNPVMSARIGDSQPLHLRWNAAEGLRLSGAAVFSLTNGMYFRGRIRLEDPVYQFLLEAGGVQVALVRDLAGRVPVLPPEAAFQRGGVFDERGLELWSDYLAGMNGALGAAGVVSQAVVVAEGERPDFGGAGASDMAGAALDTWARLSAMEAHFGGRTNSLETLGSAMEVFSVVSAGNLTGPGRFGEVLADGDGDGGGGGVGLRGLAGAGAGPGLSGVLQLDLGRAEASVAVAGPGQAMGRSVASTTGLDVVMPAEAGVWNAVGPQGSGSVRYADGVVAAGVTVAVGRGISAGDLVVDPTRAPVVFAIPDDADRRRGGVYDSGLMEDALGGSSGGAGPGVSMGVRVRGLPPGYYYVFGMIHADRDDIGTFRVHAGGSDVVSVQHDVQGLVRPGAGREVTGWERGVNFTLNAVEIGGAGTDLLVVSERVASVPPVANELLAGQLSGVQVVAPRVRLERFEADAGRVPLGGQVRLRWETRHGQRVILSGTDNTRMEFGPGASTHEVGLSPLSTVTYTLTVTNRNGPGVSANVTVAVDGAQAVQNGVVTAAREQFRVGGRLKELMDAAADCALRGGDECEVPTEELCGLVGPFLKGMQETLLDCRALTAGSASVETMIEVMGEALELVQDSVAQREALVCATAEGDLEVGDFAVFADCVLLDVYARTGLTNALVAGTNRVFGVDGPRVRSFAVTDSLRLVKSVLDLAAGASRLGSELGVSDDWLVAHATNVLRRVEEGAGTAALASQRLESELAGFVDGLALVEQIRVFAPDRVPVVSPDLGRNVAQALLEQVRVNLGRYREGTFGLWLVNPRYWEQEVVHLRHALVLNRELRDGSISNAIQTAALDVALAMKDGADFSDEIRPHDVRTLRFLQAFLGQRDIADAYGHRIRIALEFIAEAVPAPAGVVSLDRLQRNHRFVGQLADLQQLIDQARALGVTVGVAADLEPLFLATRLLESARLSARALGAEGELLRYVGAVFQARRNLKAGLSTLLEAEPIPGDGSASGGGGASLVGGGGGLDGRRLQARGVAGVGLAAAVPAATDAFGLALVRASFPAMTEASAMTRERVGVLEGVGDDVLAPEFGLPAGLRVDRVFGEFYFNRLTGFLQGGFGGALVVPGSEIAARIDRARMANDGSFAIRASVASPLGAGGVFLNAGMDVAYAPGPGLNLSGTGTLLLPSNVTTQAVSLRLFYDEAGQRAGFGIADEGANLRLGEDFVLFDVGGGLEVGTATPTGRLTLSGSVGMFARTKPVTGAVTRSNYWLTVDDAVVSVAVEAGATVVQVEQGRLRLPEFFSPGVCATNVAGVVAGPSVQVEAGRPIRLVFREGQALPEFSGEFEFSSVGMSTPGLPELGLEICRARLRFQGAGLPVLTNLSASVRLPIPGRTNRVEVVDAGWAVDGYPVGTVRLRDDLEVYREGGFDLRLLGSVSNLCSLPTALTVARGDGGRPLFRVDGGMEFGVPPEVLGSTNGGRVFVRSCGFVAGGLDGVPQVGLNDVAVGGTFRLGGAQGLLIENGLVAMEGLTNLFGASEARPFVVRVSGNANVPFGPRLGLQDARFTFTGAAAPRFSLAGFSVVQNPEYEVAPGLALNVSAASLQFVDGQRPLPGLLFPDNVVIGVSASVALPPGPEPVITGTVQGMTLRLRDGRLEPSVAGLGISFVNFEIPPLTLTGEVFLGGLDGAEAGSARALAALTGAGGGNNGLYFAGRVGGTLNDIGVKALVAFDMNGPIGVCLDANAGPAGIPLGPTGFLLTGVQGGVSFQNSNGDPCDFTTFYPVGADGRPVEGGVGTRGVRVARPGPVVTWEEYRESLARARLAADAERTLRRVGRHAPPAGEEFPCPTGDCPPASVNILCQPHPDEVRFPDRVIMKFSSLDARALDGFGITRGFVEGLGATPSAIGAGVAGAIRAGLDPLIPRADPGLLGAGRAAELNAFIVSQLDRLEVSFSESIRQALGGGGSVYDRVLEAAYAGVSCPDATVKLAGTFSHAAVSTALSGTVGVVLSSSGSAGLVGSLNVMGVPVGRMRSFVNVTDERGDPNPSYCGEALLALGPVEFGQMRSRFECPGCVTGFLGAFGQLTGCMAETTVRETLGRVAPQHASKPLAEALAALNDEEKIGFVAHVFSQPPLPGLADCWRDAARTALESFAPAYALCGATQPKIFGIPLGDSVVEVRAGASRTNLAAAFAFSPTFILNNLAACGATIGLVCQPIFPALDSATLGFGLGFPDPVGASVDALDGKLSTPGALAGFVRDGFGHLLANATVTIGYQLNPFGFKLADGEGRAVFPNLVEHPARPGAPVFRTPESRGLPSRLELLLGALRADLIANPLWKGSAADIHLAFPEGSAQRAAVQGRGIDFAGDYFPHGGILGAGRIALPKLLVDAPPEELGVVFDGGQDPLARLSAVADLIGNHLLQTSDVGTLAFYVPAPNPPFFADGAGRPLEPESLLRAIGSVDLSVPNLANPYPFEVSFLRGEMEGRLIGVPIARAEVVMQPATAQSAAFLRATAGVPADSWLRGFVESAQMTFEIRQAPPVAIEEFFGGLHAGAVALASQPSPSPAAVAELLGRTEAALADMLPKVSMEVQVNNLRIPAALTNLLTTASASAALFAYSPRFEPGLVADTPVERARRDGGIALRGSFRFADLLTIEVAELAVVPKANPALPPALSGLFRAGSLPMGITTLRDADIQFDTEPLAGEPFLRGSGRIDPIVFRNPLNQGELLSIRPLAAGATALAGRLEVVRGVGGRVAASVVLDPARLSVPMLGPDVSLTIHGADASAPFRLSTDGPWGAAVSLRGALTVRDPLGREVVRAGLGADQAFSAVLTGRGFEIETLDIALPGALELTVFPGMNNLGDLPRTYRMGSGAGTLVVRRDGTFTLRAALGGEVSVPSLPAPLLGAGAALTVTQSGLVLEGQFQGGLLASGVRASGRLEYDVDRGVSLTGEAVLPPQAFGVFRLQGADRPELSARLFRDGYSLDGGARLQVVGVAADLLSISPFTNRAGLDFTAQVTSGDFVVPNAFRLSGGRMELRRRGGVVSLLVTNAPTLTLLPGAEVQTAIAAPFSALSVADDGQFYADTGVRTVNLLGGANVRGRLEIGNVAGQGQPSMSVQPTALDFGSVDLGSVGGRVARFRNTGNEPLVVSLLSSSGLFVPAFSDFPIAAGAFVDVPVEFRPAQSGSANALLTVVMNPGGAQPSVSMVGTGRPVPILVKNPETLAFGSVAQGKTVNRTLNLRNLGTAPLVISQGTVTGPFTVTPPLAGRSIAAGSSLAVTVIYNGSAVGVHSGLLTLVANDRVGTHRVELSGTTFAERWLLVHEGGPRLHDVAMLDEVRGWAVGEESTLLQTVDGGRSWRRVNPGFGGDFRSLAITGDRVAIAGHGGVVGLSTDRGVTWRRIAALPAAAVTSDWEAVLIDPDGLLVLAGARETGGGIVVRESSASVFQVVAQPVEALHAMAQFKGSASLPNRLMAVGDGGRVLRSADGGATWAAAVVQPGLALRGVALSRLLATETDPRVLIVGDSGMFLRAGSFLGALQRTIFTLRDFRAAAPGVAVGADGLLVQAPLFNATFAVEDATGAYDLEGVRTGLSGTFAVGQAGQIWFRPVTAPTGPYLTFDPGHLDFGVLRAGQARSLEVALHNRGPAALNVSSVTVNGSAAFSVSASQFLNVPSNAVRTLTVRFAPTTSGHQTAVIELATSESAVRQRITVEGRAQANDWVFLSQPGPARLVDLQMVSDTVGYAASAGQVFRTLDGGSNWTARVTAPSTISRVHFASSVLGFAVGGDVSGRTFPPCTNDCQSFILRTGNSGLSWSSRPTGVGTPVADLHMAGTATGFAVTRSESSFLRTTPGDVLKTVDGGLTWTLATRPVPLSGVFHGTAVHAVSATTVFVAGRGELFRSVNGGSTWSRVLNLGTAVIADLEFTDANHGVLVGSGGLFRRTTTGGAVSTAWPARASFTTADLRRVDFLNTATGWVTGADASNAYLFRTDNGGGLWVPEVREPVAGDGGPTGVSGRTAGVAYATDGAAVLRSGARGTVLPGIAAMPVLRDFGMVSLGTAATNAVVIRNLGPSALRVDSLRITDGGGGDGFDLVGAIPASIPAFGSVSVPVRFGAVGLGRRVARLVLITDGYESAAGTDLVGEGRVFPTPLTFETEPPGLALNLDGRVNMTGPVTVTVVQPSTVPDDVINLFEWPVGTTHTVTAPASQVRGGYEYRFQGWQPGQPDAVLRLVATNVAATYRAVYVPVRPVGGGGTGTALALASAEVASAGSGLPHGPFVRVSNATLNLPGLGEAAVAGTALLASDRFQFALSTARLGDPRLVAVDAGSWAVAYTNSPQRFVVRTQNPGLTVLGVPAGGESQFTFDISRSQVVAQVRTLGSVPFVPGVAELGAATLLFTNAQVGGVRVSSLAANVPVRVLPKPGGGFAVERTVAFRATDGPFTNAITSFSNPILSTPLLEIRPGSGARVEIRRDAQGVYGVSVANMTLSLFGGVATPVSGAVSGGRLQLTAGRTLGLGQLVYTANSNPRLEWDLSGPSFRVVVPGGALSVPGVGGAIAVGRGWEIDTAGDFDLKLPLPALQFDGIGIQAGGSLDHNFVRFRRQAGVAGFQIRDRRTFFGNTFGLRFDINTAGVVSGRFEGELVLRDFLGCDRIGLGEISLAYDGGQPEYQFQGRALGTICSQARADFRVQFGSGGGRVCHLVCADGCGETVCLTLP
jgi:photosystem II stability/assembly factor-like uncharacterized protein